jgi:hypothetical protein
MTRDHDDHGILFAEAFEDLEPIEIGQTQVEQDEIGVRAPNGADPLLAAVGAEHLVPRPLEVRPEG